MVTKFKFSRLQVLSSLSLALYLFLAGHFLFAYSISEGLYFEFSLLAFLGLAIAGFLNSTNIAISTLAFSMPQISAWFLDVLWYSFRDHSLFGLLEAKFHPAISNIDFYCLQYPLLLIPLGYLLTRNLPKPHKPPFILTAIFCVVGLLLSRFVFLGEADANCSFISCVDFLATLPTNYYPWVFILFYSSLSLAFVACLTWHFKKTLPDKGFAKNPQSFAVIYFCFSLMMFFVLAKRFTLQPRFYCQSSQAAPQGVELNCKYALDISGTHFSQYFDIYNRSKTPQQCNLYMDYQGKKELMYGAVLIRSNRKLRLSVAVMNPKDPQGSTVILKPECTPFF